MTSKKDSKIKEKVPARVSHNLPKSAGTHITPKSTGTLYPDDPQLPSGEYEVGLVGGKFSDGDPSSGTPPSRLPSSHLNLLTDSIAEVIKGFLNGQIDNVDTTQLFRAIETRVSEVVQGITPKGRMADYGELLAITNMLDRDAYFVENADPQYPDVDAGSLYYYDSGSQTWVFYLKIDPSYWIKPSSIGFSPTDDNRTSTDKAIDIYFKGLEACASTIEDIEGEAKNISVVNNGAEVLFTPQISGMYMISTTAKGNAGGGNVPLLSISVNGVDIVPPKTIAGGSNNETYVMSITKRLQANDVVRCLANGASVWMQSCMITKIGS